MSRYRVPGRTVGLDRSLRPTLAWSLGIVVLLSMAVQPGLTGEDYRSAGEESWVRFTFQLKDAKTGESLQSGRVYYLSEELGAYSFHPENHQPLLPAGVYRLAAWKENYWQWEGILNVDPKQGLRQQRTIELDLAAIKRNDASRLVPEFLSGLLVVGNASEKMKHMNGSWFGLNNFGSSREYACLSMNAWSEFPGEPGRGSNISSLSGEYWFYHTAEGAKEAYELQTKSFTLNPSKGDRMVGPVAAAIGDEALSIFLERPRLDGRPGNYNEVKHFLLRYQNVVIKLEMNRQLNAPFLATAEDLLRRAKALDMRQVKRLLQPEPFPWPDRPPRVSTVAPPTQATPPVTPVPVTPVVTPIVPGTDGAGDTPSVSATKYPEWSSQESWSPLGKTPASSESTTQGLDNATATLDEVIVENADLSESETPPVAPPALVLATGLSALVLGAGALTQALANGGLQALGELFGGTAATVQAPPPAAPVAPVAPPLPPPVAHHDGEVNENGEVWSDEDRGWVGRNLYEQEKTRRAWLEQKDKDDLVRMREQDEGVKEVIQSGKERKVKLDRLLEARKDAELYNAGDATKERVKQAINDLDAGRDVDAKTIQEVDRDVRNAKISSKREDLDFQEKVAGWDRDRAAYCERLYNGVNVVQYTCDRAIDVLETVTGPVGKGIAWTYTGLKGIAHGVGAGLSEGNWVKNLRRGAFESAQDLAFKKGMDKLSAPGSATDFSEKTLGEAFRAAAGRPKLDTMAEEIRRRMAEKGKSVSLDQVKAVIVKAARGRMDQEAFEAAAEYVLRKGIHTGIENAAVGGTVDYAVVTPLVKGPEQDAGLIVKY